MSKEESIDEKLTLAFELFENNQLLEAEEMKYMRNALRGLGEINKAKGEIEKAKIWLALIW